MAKSVLDSLKLGKPKAKFYTTIKFKAPISRDGESRGSRKARRTFRRGG
ncbi:hypothetical protein LCGC14_1936400 [marine sediment metagenome]|uniref:Uncharacterized protein n=1 Tax=marine sediment metagenome TaxID=412755 RepID=A0A0F9I074_9ZZZZ